MYYLSVVCHVCGKEWTVEDYDRHAMLQEADVAVADHLLECEDADLWENDEGWRELD